MTALRPVLFGEVLFDCFEDGSRVLGGAPFNVAWHLQAFGCEPLFISRVGRDARGDEVLGAMRDWGMNVAGIQRDEQFSTGRVDVYLVDGDPSYDIVHPVAWDAIAADAIPSLPEGSLLYHGSLALRSETSRAALRALLAHCRMRFVDVNLRRPWWDRNRVEAQVRGADWLKLNASEYEDLRETSGETPEAFRQRLQVGSLLLTRGASGASLLQDGQRQEVTPPPVARLVDAVGAGDAFASVLLVGILRRWPLAVTLDRAQSFASAILGQRGAIVRDSTFYEPFNQAW